MDPRRLSAKLQYRSYGEFPLLVQSEERRDRHFPHPSGDGQPHFYRPIHPSGHARDHRLPHLELVGGEEAQTSVKFIKPPSPHPQTLSQWERVAEGRVRGPWWIEPHSSAF